MPLFIYKPIEEHFSWSMKQFGTSWLGLHLGLFAYIIFDFLMSVTH